MASICTGIAHQPHGQTTIEYLPLEEVRVEVWVVDVSSRIVLTQTFYNPSDEPTARAKYVFPLPANAAVCAFKLELDDGSIIIGEVKEKEEAARTFTSAVGHGKVAALVETVTDDIFTISVGCIPPSTRVEAHLTFVMDLLDEALSDHVRLQLPIWVAERYGIPPAGMHNASAADSRTRVHISVDIQTSGVIYAVRSPTHHVALQRYKERSGPKSKRRVSVVWKSSEFLTSDFVVTIHAEGLDKPRCFAEVLNASEAGDQDGATIAMQLTLVPRVQTHKVSSQEYIFIIDRSGSMDSDPIETAKRTLIMLLRLLPSRKTTFNIFSFGSEVTSLWPNSRALDSASLNEATTHVNGMDANYGGTEIPKALRSAFSSRALDRPAVVFLLTDGQIYPANTALDAIADALQISPTQAPTRLFVLGIGTGVSSDVCSSLARQGNGEYLFALSSEDIFGKCARLLNAGRSKNIEHIEIDWGYVPNPDAYLSSATISNLPAGLPSLSPPPPVQQAPHSLKKIFSGVRFTVFAITSFKTVPQSIRLITKLDGGSGPQELIVNVTKVKPFRDANERSAIPILHTLAARRLIMELDDKMGPLPTPAADDALLVSEDDLRMAGIVRLGLAYHLVSKHTSFVAVRKEEGERRHGVYRRGSTAWARSRLLQTDMDFPEDSPAKDPSFPDSLIDWVSSFITSAFSLFINPVALASVANNSRTSHHPGLPGVYDQPDSDASQGRGHSPRRTSSLQRRSSSLHYSIGSFSSLSSLEGSSCSGCWTSSRSPSPLPGFRDPIDRAPSPAFLRDANAQGLGIISAGPGLSAIHGGSSQRHPIPQEVYDLFQEMSVDGSFAASPLLLQLVGDAVLSKGDEFGIDKRVWATVVVVAYIKTRLQREPDLLDLMWEKAKEFVDASEWSRRDGTRDFDKMVRQAAKVLTP